MHSVGLQVLLQLREELNYLLYYNTIQGQCLNVNRVSGFSVRIIVIGKKIYLRIIATEIPIPSSKCMYFKSNISYWYKKHFLKISLSRSTYMDNQITYVDTINLA